MIHNPKKPVSSAEHLQGHGHEPGNQDKIKITFYDTFDWRLYNNSLMLFESDKKLYLNKFSDNESIYSIPIDSIPVFVNDYPECEFKDHLAPVIEMRALLKIVELEAGAELKNIGDSFLKAMESANIRPGSYSTKIDISLAPDMRSDEALKTILRFLLSIIKINVSQIERDLDTEFIHDFRVAVRRTRSALGQIKHVFSSEETARFKEDFSFLGKLSNEVRDLDVYLLKEGEYRSKLPAALHDDIGPLFDYLHKLRNNVFKRLVQRLKSGKYKKIIRNWEDFLSQPHQHNSDASNAGVAVFDLSRKIIHKKYKDVIKTGKKTLKAPDDLLLHALRIHCKNLRYLMEFFAGLFPEHKMSKGVKILKKLQDNLGEYNDLCVQIKYLLDISMQLPLTRKPNNKTLLAIGSLISTLESEKEISKNAFKEKFAQFSSEENRAFFSELFSKEAQ
ncbi:MAG: CHAD domain-containing protein [Deltaproteobacteria bacterium]|nr:CHAD domain-containing protein [Deltaproteobacteria bacterium]